MFSDAKAVILKQEADGGAITDICRKAGSNSLARPCDVTRETPSKIAGVRHRIDLHCSAPHLWTGRR